MSEELTKLREALRRVKHEAASLADAQVIALEALTAAQPAQTDSMGMPTSCGKPACSPDEHHPLCKLHQPAAQATPEPVGEHVAVVDGGRLMFVCDAPLPDGTKLYTHAAQPVPMSSQELARIADECGIAPTYGVCNFGRRVEAHHGITAQAKEGA